MLSSYSTGWSGAEVGPGGEHLCIRRWAAKFQRHALGVAVFDSHAVAVGGKLELGLVNVVLRKSAEQLGDFFLQLFFFVLDEGDDVAKDVKRRDARVARAGNRLHGGDENAFDAEGMFDGRESEGKTDGAAVGVGNDVAAGLPAPGLLFDQGQVVGVDLGNNEGNVGGHAEGGGVRDHGASGGCEFGLEFVRNGRVKRGEDDAR